MVTSWNFKLHMFILSLVLFTCYIEQWAAADGVNQSFLTEQSSNFEIMVLENIKEHQIPPNDRVRRRRKRSKDSAAAPVTESTKQLEEGSSTEPGQVPEVSAEPEPDWSSALQTWGVVWDLHVYLFAVLYTSIAVTSGIGLAYDVISNRGIKGLKLTLYLTLMFFSCSRATILFADPYHSRGILEMISTHITWSLGFPCVLTAFGLLLLVLVDSTKMHLAPPRFQKFSTALGIMAINATMVAATDVVMLFSQRTAALMLICNVYFVFFGLLLSAGFLQVGFRLSSNTAAATYGDFGLQRLRTLVFMLAVAGLLLVGTQIYAVIESSLRSDTPEAWPWYGVETSLRALETIMCVIMLLIIFNNKVSSQCLKNVLPTRFRNTISPSPAETKEDHNEIAGTAMPKIN